MSNAITDLTAATFDETIQSADRPVLVDFWAEWCGPCKLIAPILEEIADERNDSLTIAKVDVDQAGELAQRYQVMSIPTLLLFKDGEVAHRIVGSSSKSKLLEDLAPHL